MGGDGVKDSPVLIACAVGFLTMVGDGVASTLIPVYAVSLGMSSLLIGTIVSSFFWMRAAAELPTGILSDRVGRLILILVGLPLWSLGMFLFGSTTDPSQLMVYRSLWGLGSTLFFGASFTFVTELLGPERRGRSFGVWMSSAWTGSLVGQMMSGYVASLMGYGATFLIGGGLVLASFGVVAASPSMRAIGTQHRSVSLFNRASLSSLWNVGFAVLCGITLSRFLVEMSVVGTVLPVYAKKRLMLDDPLIGVLMASRTLGFIAATLLGFVSDRVGRRPVLSVGLVLTALANGMIGFAPTFESLLPVMLFEGFSAGLMWSVLPVMVGDVTDASVRGLAMGIFRTIFNIGALVGPVMMMVVYESYGAQSSFNIGTVWLLLNLPLVLLLRKGRQGSDQGVESLPSTTTLQTTQPFKA